MSDLAQRYALAAIEACPTPAAGEELADELEQLAPYLQRSGHLFAQLTAPGDARAHHEARTKLYTALALSRPAIGLMHVLLRNGRLALFADIAAAARREVDRRGSRRRAYVRSATALDEAQLHKLETILTQRFGMPIVAHVTVDPQLRAGLICRVGSVTIDSSLKSQLRRVARQLA